MSCKSLELYYLNYDNSIVYWFFFFFCCIQVQPKHVKEAFRLLNKSIIRVEQPDVHLEEEEEEAPMELGGMLQLVGTVGGKKIGERLLHRPNLEGCMCDKRYKAIWDSFVFCIPQATIDIVNFGGVLRK